MTTPTRVTLPGKPDKAADFDLGNGKYARVVYTVQSNTGNTMMVEFQAFEVDANGVLQAAPNGAASRTPSQLTEVHLSGCRGPLPTVTLKAGWVYNPPKSGEIYAIDMLPEGCTTGEGAPTEPGTEGALYFDTVAQMCWKWHPGAIEGPLVDKAIELQTILENSDALTDFTL